MKKLNAILVFLISSLTITGISTIDGKIWDIIFLVVSMLAYAIVGVLFLIGILHGKHAGKDAYALIFILLILGGYAVCNGLVRFNLWVLVWPLFVKILVPSVIVLLIALVVILCNLRRSKDAKNIIN